MSDITKAALLSTLPPVLANDSKFAALADAVAGVLADRITEISAIAFYNKIDSMPEVLLDILAQDFKIDWWVPTATVDEKRATLKEAWTIHASLGTKKAMEDALSAIYDGTQVVEWFEYSGQPYHFEVYIDASYQGIDPEKYALVVSKVKYYKNLRSVLDAIEFVEMSAAASEYAHIGCAGYAITDGCATE